MTPEQRLQELGLVLPAVTPPRGNFDAFVIEGNMLYLSGKGSPLRQVNATPDFVHRTEVVNGCSDLLVEAFGERGRHARSAVGVGSLPRGLAVEIEAVVAFED